MLSRFCCLWSKSKEKDNEAELVEGLLASSNSNPKKSKSRCNTNCYTLYSEATWNFFKTTASTFISNANLITYLIDLTPEFLGLNLYAAYASLPIAVIFAICETYAHLQQSQNLDETVEELEEGLNRSETGELPPITCTQGLGSTLHYLSDVLSDAAGFLSLMQLAGADKVPLFTRYLYSGGVLALSANGNVREFMNTITSARLRNARAT